MLDEYFTQAEILGLETKNCGDVKDPENPWRWLGGPCCPNNHIYGWRSLEPNSTTPLRKVEVDREGNRMPPFQIKTLMKALKLSKGTKKEYTILIYGDSTQRQLFYGMLCAFVRIGGKVTKCLSADPSSHYSHPLCKRAPKSFQPKYHIHASISFDGGSGVHNGSTTVMTTTYHVRYQADGSLQGMDKIQKIIDNKTRSEALLLREAFFNETISPPPDILLINHGVHAKRKEQLVSAIALMMNLFSRFQSSIIVWRGTTVQHFYKGSYESWNNAKNVRKTCGDLSNLTESNLWRQEIPKEWFKNNAPEVPVLSVEEMELHLYETYSKAYISRKPDCTHHVYTPLYYDSLFRRLAEILPFPSS